MKKFALLAVLCCALSALGCAKTVKQEITCWDPLFPPVREDPAPKPVQPTPRQVYEADYAKLPSSYTVARGDSLWRIARSKRVYNDPFMWPLIAKANRVDVRHPRRIPPGQVLKIPRDFSLDEAKAARRRAGRSQRHAAPTRSANLPAAVRESLGYGF